MIPSLSSCTLHRPIQGPGYTAPPDVTTWLLRNHSNHADLHHSPSRPCLSSVLLRPASRPSPILNLLQRSRDGRRTVASAWRDL